MTRMNSSSGGALPPLPTTAKRLLSAALIRITELGMSVGSNPEPEATYTEHDWELEVINMIYCHVLSFAELREVMKI